MRTIRTVSTLAAMLFVVCLLSGKTQAKDNTVPISGSLSGSAILFGVSFDFDNDVPIANTAVDTGGGVQNFGGKFTEQAISEADLVTGSGCAIPGLGGVQGCTIDGANNGCLENIVGGFMVNRFDSNGDLLRFQITGGTQCVGPTLDVTGTEDISLIGGTGKFAGTSGTATLSFNGQLLNFISSGYGIGWFQGTYTGTLTKP